MPAHPSIADRGFAPVTYTKLDQKFGSWGDIEAFTKD
jgi:sucrose phosphorylase